MNLNNGKRPRIGILTFHYAVNPGSTWQAYGLYKTISSLSSDINVNIINYHEDRYRRRYLFFQPKRTIAGNINQLYKICSYHKYQRFWNIIGEGLTKRLNDRSFLGALDDFDVIVAGSDQIWNLELTGRNFNFFIPIFNGVKKVSYAASIGTEDFPEEDKEIVAKYLSDFTHLSVREPQAQLAIHKLIGRRPELMIDPSLLLRNCDYELLAKKPKINKDYLFLYLIHKNSEIVPFARKFAKEKGLQIVECHSGIRRIFKDDRFIKRPDPREWLGWLMNAKYIFTDSFHGCAFCINCNKQFYVKISSANSDMSSRIYNILERYDMKDRLVLDEKQMFSIPDIDFSKSNILLEKDRKFAVNYLRTALGIKQL